MLSAAQLASMRATVVASLPDTATISRPSRTSDGRGGAITTWQTVASDVRCRLGPNARGDESVSGGKVGFRSFYNVTFPAGQDVRSTDRVVIGSRTFEVIEILDLHDSWELGRKVALSEVV